MSTSRVPLTFLPLGKNNEDIKPHYYPWRSKVTDIASRVQLLHLVLTPVAFALTNDGLPFAPPVHPGPMPLASSTQNTVSIWSLQLNYFKEYQARLEDFKAQLVDSLGPAPLMQAADAQGLTHTRTVVQILDALDTAYAVVTREDLLSNRATLGNFSRETTYDDHVAVYTRAYQYAARNGQPFSASEQTELFLQSFAKANLLATERELFSMLFREVDKQTFANAIMHLRSGAEKMRNPTAQHSGYTAAAAAATTAPTSNDMFDKVLAATIAHFEHHALAVPQTTRPAKPPLAKWCWTHGKTQWSAARPSNLGHTSAECRHPAIGHRKEATERNKLGSTA